ncbi:MAG: hypothetical protein APF84_07310, partial [Gracilibacter sp. BRH_c7a]
VHGWTNAAVPWMARSGKSTDGLMPWCHGWQGAASPRMDKCRDDHGGSSVAVTMDADIHDG